VRRPAWARAWAIAGIEAGRITDEGGLLHLSGPWRGTTEVAVRLAAQPEIRSAAGEAVVAWGPLLFAQPIPGRRDVVRTHPAAPDGCAFRDIVVDRVEDPVAIDPDQVVSLTPVPAPPGTEAAAARHAWQRLGLSVTGAGGGAGPTLVPMGATVLRRLTLGATGPTAPVP
jgi:hypothetical protein